MKERETIAESNQRYLKACHAMQSGVKFAAELGLTPNEQTPKHLRVGVNSALVNDAALIRLLMAKHIITPEEYQSALADEMEREAQRYERELTATIGRPVILE